MSLSWNEEEFAAKRMRVLQGEEKREDSKEQELLVPVQEDSRKEASRAMGPG